MLTYSNKQKRWDNGWQKVKSVVEIDDENDLVIRDHELTMRPQSWTGRSSNWTPDSLLCYSPDESHLPRLDINR